MIAVTKPAVLTVAVGLDALHAPPVAPSVSITGDPRHTFEGPVMLPAAGADSTDTVFVADTDPQLPVTVYEIVSTPAVIPFTTPALTVALPLLALQVPPGVPSVKVIVVPAHTAPEPVIVPADSAPITVTVSLALTVPQLLVTE